LIQQSPTPVRSGTILLAVLDTLTVPVTANWSLDERQYHAIKSPKRLAERTNHVKEPSVPPRVTNNLNLKGLEARPQQNSLALITIRTA